MDISTISEWNTWPDPEKQTECTGSLCKFCTKRHEPIRLRANKRERIRSHTTTMETRHEDDSCCDQSQSEQNTSQLVQNVLSVGDSHNYFSAIDNDFNKLSVLSSSSRRYVYHGGSCSESSVRKTSTPVKPARWKTSSGGRRCFQRFPRLIMLLYFYVFLVVSCGTHASRVIPNVNQASQPESKVCQHNIEVRNSPAALERLRGCRVVEGHVRILLFDRGNESDYENCTYPELQEITGHLMMYRVSGLTTLSKLFPNLAVIRGHTLFETYALVLYEMMHLQDVGLKSLTDIVRGSVRIDKNPMLCFVHTVDWTMIARSVPPEEIIVMNNKPIDECPTCTDHLPSNGTEIPNSCPLARAEHFNKEHHLVKTQSNRLCWNQKTCQKTCPDICGNRSCNKLGECCDEKCLGGCDGPRMENCTVCRDFSIGDVPDRKCVQTCPKNTYAYLSRRCVLEHECHNLTYKTFNNSECILQCPPDYSEGVNTAGQPTCKPCEGRCIKWCNGAVVSTIDSARQMRGCTHINGSLEIMIHGARNVVKELEDHLSMIEEIRGYLKVIRSFPLVSLNFLRKLRIIHGNELEGDKVLSVVDNQNLAELWDWKEHKPIKILKGKLHFHFNPKLCYAKIHVLGRMMSKPVTNFTEVEVDPLSNGDKVACDVRELNVSVRLIRSTVVMIQWKDFDFEDRRHLLGYMVFVILAPYRNVSLYDGRDACGGDGWKVHDVMPNKDEHDKIYNQILTHLKPYTQYAFYVKTYTIASEKNGGQSPLQYFVTMPDQPDPPKRLQLHSNSSSELIITWDPPAVANGNITSYIITGVWEIKKDDPEQLQQRNYCAEPKQPDKQPNHVTVVKEDPKPEPDADNPERCNCNGEYFHRSNYEDESERLSQMSFEDALQNEVYIKYTGPPNYGPGDSRRKRSAPISPAERNEAKTRYLRDVSTELNRITSDKDDGGSAMVVDEMLGGVYHKFQRIVYNSTSFVMRSLRHYSSYSISIMACRASVPNDMKPNCSITLFGNQRTQKLEHADDIPGFSTPHVQSSNHSLGEVTLRWQEPPQPNGLILTYQIQYKRVDIERVVPTTECIPRRLFTQQDYSYTLHNLPPGSYSVRVMASSLAGDGDYTPYKTFVIPEAHTGSRAEVIVGSVLGTVLVAAILLALAYFVRRKYLPSASSTKLIASVNPEYVSMQYQADEWEVLREDIQLIKELGQGSFGMVYEGVANNLPNQTDVNKSCAVKTVNEHATDRERIEFLNEASVMKAFDTAHVVSLLGVVSKGQPTLVVMELMVNGDLKSYLRLHRPDGENTAEARQPPTLRQILQMAIEIADGMAYLSAKKFVHRDLAARNCMVAGDLTVKIGDFGMTRDIYETDYYRKGTKGLLPVRWMAPESLKDGVFTSSSDVWSYGVVLWEMATLASQPYQGLSNDQVLRYVIEGGVMERPEHCPDKLYQLMEMTWQHKPTQRPSFLELVKMLDEESHDTFKKISFYHSAAGREALQTIYAAHANYSDDPCTPLRAPLDGDLMEHNDSDHGGAPSRDSYHDSLRYAASTSGTSRSYTEQLEAFEGVSPMFYSASPQSTWNITSGSASAPNGYIPTRPRNGAAPIVNTTEC